VERHHGVIAQHQGDGLFVWFGYPTPHDDDAHRAVRAGLDMLAVLQRLGAGTGGPGDEPLAVRIAVHAGEVLVAPVDGERLPIAFGHTPNVAAKLQHSARPGTVVISEAVGRLVEGRFDLVASEPTLLPDGTTMPVFEVLRERPSERQVGRIWKGAFVGRAEELGRARRAWAAVQDGGAASLVIAGARGIGKTRLASALVAEAHGAGALVLDAACHRLDAGSPYRPFRSLLAQATDIEPADPANLAAAALRHHVVDRLSMDESSVRVLAGVLGIEHDVVPPPDLDPAKLAEVTTVTLVAWLRRLAETAPTILLIDDAPDADPSSHALLAELVTSAPPGLLLVLTARSDVTWPAALLHPRAETLTLRALSDREANELVAGLDSAASLDPVQRDQVLRLGDGVPFYLEELARAALVDRPGVNLPITLSERLQAVLRAPGLDRDVISALSVAGQEVPVEILAGVLDTDPDALEDRMAGLLAADLVVDVGTSGPAYQFRHGLLADAAEAMLLQSQRARLHGRFASILREQPAQYGSPDWLVVGQHLLRAGLLGEGCDAILLGAEQSRRRGAFNEALNAYRDVLTALEGIADEGVHDVLEVRCRLHRGIAAISARGFGADEAIEDFARCSELCRTLGPRPEHLSALSGVYAFYLLQGELAQARAVVEDLRSWVDLGHADHRAENWLGFGVLSFFEGDLEPAATQLTLASDHPYARSDDAGPTAEQTWLLPFDPLVTALTHLAVVRWLTGHPSESGRVADRACARAAELPFPEGPFSVAYAKSYLAWIHNLGGHPAVAARLAAEVRELGARHGFLFWESTGDIHLALAEFSLGRRADAWDVVQLHASIWELLRARVFLPYVLTAAADVKAAMGSTDEAMAGFDAAARMADLTGARFYEAERLRLQARACFETDQSGATDLRRQAWELARRQGALVFELRAALDAARFDGEPEWRDRVRSAADRFPAGAGYLELNEAQAVLAELPTEA
jgi:hypothetical protein